MNSPRAPDYGPGWMSELMRPPATRPHSAAPSRALAVGFLAQENLAVPPPVPGASVSRVVYELAIRLAAQADVTVCSIPHPSLPAGRDGGVLYLRTARRESPVERSAGEALRLFRRLDLPHRELQGLGVYGRRYARAGLRLLAARRPDVLHVQNMTHYVPLAAAARPDALVVLHMHCDWLSQLPRRTVERNLRQAGLVVCVSDHLTGRVRARFPRLRARVETLHNGVDTDRFRPRSELSEDTRLGAKAIRDRLAGDGPLVLYVGSLAPEKGVHVLLEAFERPGIDATLVLVGRHNRYFQVVAAPTRAERRRRRLEQRSYADLLRRSPAARSPRAVFAGGVPHDALPAWYAAADLLVMPSTGAEPFGLPVAEAMASGLPVVATRVGGLPEVVADGETGLLVPPGDADALAAALSHVLAEPGLGAALGAAGRARACARFSWDAQASRLAGLYRELLGVTSRAGAPRSRATVDPG